MTAITQNSLPDAPWMSDITRRLPGVQPLAMAEWLCVDDAYASQMAEREKILGEYGVDVVMATPGSEDAQAELLDVVLEWLAEQDDFAFSQDHCKRSDGQRVQIDQDNPLKTLGRLVAEDFCILEKQNEQHVLTAAILCFPASWTLAEKIGKPLDAIHDPVMSYTPDIARRVQRLFDAVQVGRPLWRANALHYVDPTLYQPRTMEARRVPSEEGKFIRSERQSILRLPKTDAVIFSIHTRQVRLTDLTAQQSDALLRHPIQHDLDPNYE